MAGSECMTIQNIVLKTEPADSFENEDCHDVSSSKSNKDCHDLTSSRKRNKDCHDLTSSRKRNNESLRCLFTNKEFVSGAECKHETKADNHDNDNFSEDEEQVMKINKSDVSGIGRSDLVDPFPVVTEVKRRHSSDETDSHYSDATRSAQCTGFEDSADQKPSQEELATYCRASLNQSLAQSSFGRQSVSPLTHDPTDEDDCVNVRTQDCSRGSGCLSFAIPDVMPCSVSHGKYASRLSSKKEKNYSNKKFDDSEIMKAIMNKDGSITFYQCRSCKRGFSRRATLRQHFITHTDRFACPSCTTRCKSKGDLLRHIQTHTKEKPFHCDICKTDYTRESILRKHMQTKLHLRFCYEQDNQTPHLTRETDMDTFVTTQTKHKLSFPCNLCSKVTFSKSEYKKHAKSHALKHLCNICQKGCKSLLLLKIHKGSHNKSRNLICKLCSRSFANLYCLKEHAKSHKRESLSKLAEESPKKAEVRNNKRTLNSTKMCLSQQGSKSASSRVDGNSLSIVRGLECDECHKTFSSKQILAKHNCIGEEIYVCGVCTVTFPNFSKLKAHIKLHTTNIKCDICDMTFCEDKELEDHVQKFHADRMDYTCRLCYDHFNSASDLDSHINNHTATMLFSGRPLEEGTKATETKNRRNGRVPVRVTTETRTDMPSVCSEQCDKACSLGSQMSNHAPIICGGKSPDKQAPSVWSTSKRKPSVNDEVKNYNKTEALSDNEEVRISRNLVKIQTCKFNDFSDDRISDSPEYYDSHNSSVDENDDNLSDSDSAETDEELYSEIKTDLENKILVSEKSVTSGRKVPFFLRKPLVYEKHCTKFEEYSEKDVSNQSFRCKVCDIIFNEDKYLNNHHLKHHVCEVCNIFFVDKVKLSAHKSHHATQLINEIKYEGNGVQIPEQSWKGYVMPSPESKSDLQKWMLNETEYVNKKSNVARTAHFKHNLSHDEIVQANKHHFQRYSCLDPMNNVFACTICKRKYARPTTLTRHFKTHVCLVCNKFFKDKSDLQEHKYSHRQKVEVVARDNKTRSFSLVSKPNRDIFKKYSLVDADKNTFMCVLCSKGFVRRTVLTRHLKTHICSHCDQFFEDKYDLLQHVVSLRPMKKLYSDSDETDIDERLENHEKPSLASSVVEKLNQNKNKISLLPPHHKLFLQDEPSCSNRNEKVKLIQIPDKTTSEKVNRKMSCPGIFSSSSNGISKPVQIYKNISHKSFSNSSTSFNLPKPTSLVSILQEPSLSFCPEERDRPYQCGLCRKRFLKNDHLKSHMTIHTGDRPFICHVCSKSFGRSTILQKHMKTHVKVCKICNANFNFKYELDFHMAIHRSKLVGK